MSEDTRRTRVRKAAAALTAAPRKRATARARTTTGKAETVPLAVLEGEVVAASTTAASKRPTVEWRGREMAVQMLGGEQIMALTMTLKRLSRDEDTDPDDDESPAAQKRRSQRQRRIDRVMEIVLAVLDDVDDQEWVLDEFAADSLKLNDVMGLLPQAIRAAAGKPPAPATGPVSKARRRA